MDPACIRDGALLLLDAVRDETFPTHSTPQTASLAARAREYDHHPRAADHGRIITPSGAPNAITNLPPFC
jgi:hypothetical protein